MTKEEIIKGLECCISPGCDECPYYGDEMLRPCNHNMMRDAIDLIRKQGIEIECYKIANTHMHSSIIGTVKEFAELIKGIVEFDISLSESETEYLLVRIDEVLDEFVEGLT